MSSRRSCTCNNDPPGCTGKESGRIIIGSNYGTDCRSERSTISPVVTGDTCVACKGTTVTTVSYIDSVSGDKVTTTCTFSCTAVGGTLT